ncbi:MAG: QueT transporter family protein [Clostridia bacterium]|nr:QueT transporter family protein [Clostridia bacterium]
MKENKTLYLTQGAAVAALYVALTYLAWALGLSSGVIQVRFSEALTILPCFFGAAVPGLFVGCLLANLLTGAVVWDVVFGSIATLLGAIGTRLLRKNRWLACLPPIISNILIVPFVLVYAYGVPDTIPYLMLTVGAGEVISCGILGQLLYTALDKRRGDLRFLRDR